VNDVSARWWECPLEVERLAFGSVDAVVAATRELAASRGLSADVATTPELVAASFAAIGHLRVDGRTVDPWAPLSGFAEASDGWVRLHGNYPHHAAVIESVVGAATRETLQERVRHWTADDVEREVTASGGIATVVRTVDEWKAHPHARATAGDPWHEIDTGPSRSPLPPADLPMSGVRVLDLTRVLAGPTCSQMLACLGADVLRLDPPTRPELLDQYLSNGMGKRSAELDLSRDLDRVRTELLTHADVVLTGYRPDALGRFGLDAPSLQADHPRLVVASLSAWGDHGPWGTRRGFDSIVQAACGIATLCADDRRPGALPVQALDYATGYVLAADVITLLARGRGGAVRASLLGAARTLVADGRRTRGQVAPIDVPTVEVSSPHGSLLAVPPPVTLDGRTLERGVGGYAASAPAWL
jgi:hypothetical protein